MPEFYQETNWIFHSDQNSSFMTYLLDHCISHINVGFVGEWNHHVIDVVPSLGPHVSYGRGKNTLEKQCQLSAGFLVQRGNASIRVVT